MGAQLTIESPDFDRIKKESGSATRDALVLLWRVANDEALQRRTGIRLAQDKEVGLVQYDAPTTQQDNYNAGDGLYVVFTGSTAFPLTGIRNGVDGRRYDLHNLGTGTITIKYESASSDSANRFDTHTAADVTVATGKTFMVRYLNGRWRELSPA